MTVGAQAVQHMRVWRASGGGAGYVRAGHLSYLREHVLSREEGAGQSTRGGGVMCSSRGVVGTTCGDILDSAAFDVVAFSRESTSAYEAQNEAAKGAHGARQDGKAGCSASAT